MTSTPEFDAVFELLRSMLGNYADPLDCVHDSHEQYYLDTRHIMKNGKPLFFGAVKKGKRYVSYHLMPVYVDPALLNELSPGLRRRMQGKSCFNFRKVDEVPVKELGILTRRGFDAYRNAGYV